MIKNLLVSLVILVAIVGGGIAALAWRSNFSTSASNQEAETSPASGTKPESMMVKVFFGNSLTDPSSLYCDRVYPAWREIPRTEGVARAALAELLKGPTEEEQARGFRTGLNSGIEVRSLVIRNGVAEVDFSSRLGEGVGGSCLVTAIRSQITETLKQFPTIREVKLSIDGQSEDILQP